MLIKPGPAESTLSYLQDLSNIEASSVASSLGFFFNTLAAIIHTFDVACPFFKSSVTVVAHLSFI